MSTTVTTPVTVAGVFLTNDQAEQATDELLKAGFSAEEIRLVPSREEIPSCGSTPATDPSMAVGALAGASLGGLAGGFPGALACGVAGALLGGFMDLSLPAEVICGYKIEHEKSRPLVLVRSCNRAEEAADLLRCQGAQEVHITPDQEKTA